MYVVVFRMELDSEWQVLWFCELQYAQDFAEKMKPYEYAITTPIDLVVIMKSVGIKF